MRKESAYQPHTDFLAESKERRNMLTHELDDTCCQVFQDNNLEFSVSRADGPSSMFAALQMYDSNSYLFTKYRWDGKGDRRIFNDIENALSFIRVLRRFI